MRSAAFVCCALVLAPVLLAAEDAPPAPPAGDDTVHRLLAAQRFTRVLGRFTQRTTRLDEPDKEATVFAAFFALEAPDKYDVTYTKPGDDEWRLRLLSDGREAVRVEQVMAGVEPDVLRRTLAPAAGTAGAADGGAAAGGAAPAGGGPGNDDFMRRVAELVRLDHAALMRDFTVQARRADEGFTAVLVPKAASLAEHVQRIEIDTDAQLRTRVLRIDDARGNRVTVTIDEATYDGVLPQGLFTYPAAP